MAGDIHPKKVLLKSKVSVRGDSKNQVLHRLFWLIPPWILFPPHHQCSATSLDTWHVLVSTTETWYDSVRQCTFLICNRSHRALLVVIRRRRSFSCAEEASIPLEAPFRIHVIRGFLGAAQATDSAHSVVLMGHDPHHTYLVKTRSSFHPFLASSIQHRPLLLLLLLLFSCSFFVASSATTTF